MNISLQRSILIDVFYCDMTPESWNSSLLGNGSVNTSPRKRTRATIEESISEQRVGKHTITIVFFETVFYVGAAPRLYNEDLTQLELELSRVPEFHVSSLARVELRKITEKRW
jgi:hypothetical protein